MKKPQKRALETRSRILSALERLLAAREFEAISIADLARAADVAVGSVYSHFKDKSALLPALLDRQLAAAADRLAAYRSSGEIAGVRIARSSAPDLRTAIEQGLRAAHGEIAKSRGVRRALATYRRLNPDLDLRAADALHEEAFIAFLGQLDLYKDEIKHKDRSAAARMVNHFINVIFLDDALYAKPLLPASLTPAPEEKIAAYTMMLHAYLTADSN